MPARLKLYVNWFEKRLVKGPSNPGTFTLPTFYQGDTVPMQVTLLEPDPDGGPNDFVKVDIDDMALSLAVGTAPTGTSGGPTPLVTQFVWSKDTAEKYFYADVAFSTSGINDHLGSAAEKTDLYLELQITESTSVTTIWQGTIKVRAEVIEATTASVAAGATPLSKEEANQIYARKFMDPGETITFVSEDGTRRRIIGVHDDGSAIDSLL